MHKIIVAGCGNMSNRWIDIIKKRDDCKITGLVDVNIEAAKLKNEKYELSASVYNNITAALEKENANLVIDVTIPQSHYDIVTTALKAGCDVFGEKPMSDSLANAEKMVECAETAKKEYFVMQNRRYIPGICALRDFLKSGQLGKPGHISADFRLGPHFGGFRDEMDNPLIADMAIHTFDQARLITGKKAVSVYCHEFNPSWSWYRGNANAVAIFEMDDGSVFDYRGSWCETGLITSWESEWRVDCANGAVFWDGDSIIHYDTAGGTVKTKIPLSDAEDSTVKKIKPVEMEITGHNACINEMFNALKNHTRPQTDCRDNINSIRMVYRAIESAKTGKKLQL